MRRKRKSSWAVALTIAGSDPVAGAGIQADLKSFAACGVYGMSVITALTAQNTTGMSALHVPPASFVAAQLDQVLCDVGADSVKTGMLFSAAIIRVVERKILEYRIERLVVDPVMVTKSGSRLLRRNAEQSLIKRLFPLARLVTPNIPEAEVLSGIKISSLETMREAAERIVAMGPRAVIVKGGHLQGPPVDLFWDGKRAELLSGKRIGRLPAHGTGCTFSAAVAAFLARGLDVEPACRKAKRYTERTISHGARMGAGYPLLGHLPSPLSTSGRGDS